MKVRLSIVISIWCLAWGPLIGGVTYHVTENPQACHEVHLGAMSSPRGAITVPEGVDSGHCQYEIRAAREGMLYVSAACGGPRWIPIHQKYSVDLSANGRVRRITEEAWESGTPLRRATGGIPTPKDDRGVRYKGLFFEKSGPRWFGEGTPSLRAAIIDSSGGWLAVFGWDGFNIQDDFLDPTSWGRSKVEGRYWIDIYAAASGRRAIKIEGSFKGISPNMFLDLQPAWYGANFVMPLGRVVDGGASMMLQKFLVCDAGVASLKNEPALKERKQHGGVEIRR